MPETPKKTHQLHATRMIAVVLFSLGMTMSGYYMETRSEAGVLIYDQPLSIEVSGMRDAAVDQKEGSYQVSTQKDEKEVYIGGNIVVRVSPNSQVTIAQGSHPHIDGVTIVVQKGKVWINAENSVYPVTVLTKSLASYPTQIRTDVSGAVVVVSYIDEVVRIKAMKQSAYVYFLTIGLVVHDGTFTDITEAKLVRAGKDLVQLRYAKLTKEFPLTQLPDLDAWEKKNDAKDETFHTQLIRAHESDLRTVGPRVSLDTGSTSTAISDVIFDVAQAGTFSADRKIQRVQDVFFEHIETAAYALLVNNQVASKDLLEKARLLVPELSNRKEFALSLRERYAFSHPSETFYPIYEFLSEVGNRDAFTRLKDQFAGVLMSSHNGNDALTEQRVISLLNEFGDSVEKHVAVLRSPENSKKVLLLARDVRAFVMSSSTLLREQFLKILDVIEMGYLDTLKTAEASNDERQFLISDKLYLLKLVKANLDKRKISFQDARGAMLHLANRIDLLKPSLSQAAFIEYFDTQYKQQLPFLSFMRSSEAREIVGDYTEYYKLYQLKVSETQRVQDLLQTSLGGAAIPAVTRERLAKKVVEDLDSIGLEKIHVTFPDDEDSPVVKINDALFEGRTISLSYNTDAQILSDITLNAVAISNALRLDSARTFLLIKIGKLKLPVGTTEESFAAPVGPSLLEKVATEKITTELQKVGITVKPEDIDLTDFTTDVIHIKMATIGEGLQQIKLSFDVINKLTIAQHIKVTTVLGELELGEGFSLAEVGAKARAMYDHAVLDQKRNEELKELSQ
ncbi:hypothetical protein KBD59_00760 [Candidatus Gracilibacteria bacterium]|nr:hypothetical protein [Candidatus Gracilibacteria bacterium]